ncbi:MAG: hypothetical protein WC782_03005 [Methylococcaceae bacterium]
MFDDFFLNHIALAALLGCLIYAAIKCLNVWSAYLALKHSRH